MFSDEIVYFELMIQSMIFQKCNVYNTLNWFKKKPNIRCCHHESQGNTIEVKTLT